MGAAEGADTPLQPLTGGSNRLQRRQGARRGDGDRRELTPVILAAGPPLPSHPWFWAQTRFMKRGSKDTPLPLPGEGHPCETPEDPTLCQQTQEGDTGDTPGGTQNRGGISCSAPPGSGGVPVPAHRGPPQAGDSGDPQHSLMALADSPRLWAVAHRSRRSSGSIVRVPGRRGRECRQHCVCSVPMGPTCGCQPPTFLRWPRPVANRSGSFSRGAFAMLQAPAGEVC